MPRVFILIAFILMLQTSIVRAEEDSYIANGPISILIGHDDSSIFDGINITNTTMYEALALAYQNNPTLRAARAELIAVKEQLPQAQAGFKPTITAEADITHIDTETEGQSFITGDGGNTSKTGCCCLYECLAR